MIIVLEGRMGSGKTLSSTAFAVIDKLENGRDIICNYHLNGIDYKYFSYELFVEWMKSNETLNNASIIVDEAYLIGDSRMSQSGLGKLFTYFILQTRKRGVDLYITTQQFRNIDIRIRMNADVRAICKYNERTKYCTVRMIDLRSGLRRTIKIFGPDFFPYYDTKEIPALRPGHTNITL
jgi:zona occludens toxin (predicted ATPase)